MTVEQLGEAPQAPVAANFRATEIPAPKRFFLDANVQLRQLWAERAYWRNQRLMAEKWEAGFDAKVAAVMGDAEELWLDNAHVGTYTNDGTFQKKKFFTEQPELTEDCMVFQRVFSLERLKQLDPKAYTAYRARTMRIKDNPVVPE